MKGIVKAPIIDYKIGNEEFKKHLQNLGLQTKPTVDGAIALLKALVEQKESKIKRFVEIYGYLAQHIKEKKKIREELKDFHCIFAPNHKKKYWKISEVLWEGSDPFLEWKTDVGQTYPELRDFFLNVLGVKEKPTHEDYVEFLRSYLWKKEELNNREKSSLGNVYHHINYIITTPELKKSETWLSLRKGFKIWCEDNYWAEIDKEIYYNDNDELHKLFRKHTDMIFAYIPKNVEVKELFAELGIRSLSGRYVEKCSVSGEQIAAKEEYQNEMRRISKYVAHFVKEKFPKTFDRLNKEEAFSMLGEISAKFVENMEVDAIVNGYTVSLGERKSFYSWRDSKNCLYLERSLQGNDSSCFRYVGIALANAFGKATGLEILVPYIIGKDETEIKQTMQDYGIPAEEELEIEKPKKGLGVPIKGKPPVGAAIEIPTPLPPEGPPPQTSPPKKPPSIEPPSKKPPVIEPPPEKPPQEPITVITKRQIRDSRMANWTKRSYNYHCQICLSREKPELLTYNRSYAGRESNRKSIMESHHIREVARDQGHDYTGNYLSLCCHHHNLLPKLNLSLDDLRYSLNSIIEKEIIWPNGETVSWKMVTLSDEFMEENQPIQMVFNDGHLEKLKEYINYIYSSDEEQKT